MTKASFKLAKFVSKNAFSTDSGFTFLCFLRQYMLSH